jgi:tetratricopeptide (TPR) repeat protein
MILLDEQKDLYPQALFYFNEELAKSEKRSLDKSSWYAMRSVLETNMGNNFQAFADLKQAHTLLEQDSLITTAALGNFYWAGGSYYLGEKNYEAALAYIKQGLVSNKANKQLLLLQGDVYMAQGDYIHAVDSYNMLIKYYPSWYLGYYKRGLTYAANGRKSKMKADFAKALALSNGYFLPAKVVESEN